MDIPPKSSNFTNRKFQRIRDAEPREIERYRRLLTAAHDIAALEHPRAKSF